MEVLTGIPQRAARSFGPTSPSAEVTKPAPAETPTLRPSTGTRTAPICAQQGEEYSRLDYVLTWAGIATIGVLTVIGFFVLLAKAAGDL